MAPTVFHTFLDYYIPPTVYSIRVTTPTLHSNTPLQGNSGGPAFHDGKVIGIAFESLVDAENIG